MPEDDLAHERFLTLLRALLPNLPEDDAEARLNVLRDHGLDSLATVELLVNLEDEFGIEFPDDKLTSSTFVTAAALWEVVRDLLADGAR
ncbi:phosphopantetheine-binding protein [Microbacterium sp. P04]|uniref:phosphopantetheine-binding protein n=1 Tax=Microbacterium sp. P04 TaxID=3366947 RepID=UPI003747189E